MTDWFREEKQRWSEAMKAKGHIPVMDGDEIDMFVCDGGYHNGPGCESCGWSICHHCDDISDIPECSKPVVELKSGQ